MELNIKLALWTLSVGHPEETQSGQTVFTLRESMARHQRAQTYVLEFL